MNDCHLRCADTKMQQVRRLSIVTDAFTSIRSANILKNDGCVTSRFTQDHNVSCLQYFQANTTRESHS
jgi:hypothetical protein